MTLLISLTTLYASTPVSDVHAQAALGDYGCLEVRSEEIAGTYDLTQGIFIDQPQKKLPEPSDHNLVSSDGRYTGDINTEWKDDHWLVSLVVKSRNGIIKQTINLNVSTLPPNYSFPLPSLPIWSPDGRNVAFTVGLAIGGQLILAAPDSGKSQIIDVPDLVPSYFDPVWSPDSQYLAISVQAQLGDVERPYSRYAVSLYSSEGTLFPHVVDNAVGYIQSWEHSSDSFNDYYWSGDSHFLYFVQRTSGSDILFDFMSYDLKQQSTIPLLKNVLDFPVYRDDYKYALVRSQSDGITTVSLVDLLKATTLTLDTTTDVVDMKWIGNRALVRGKSHFVWSSADGMGKHRIDISPAEFDNQTLISPTSFWYRGVTAVSRDEHYLMLETDTSLDGKVVVNSGNIRQDVWLVDLLSGKSQMFPSKRIVGFSPDGSLGIVYGDGLYLLLPAQGKLTRVAVDDEVGSGTISNIQQLVWSPDNMLFVIVYSTGIGLDLIGRNGVLLRHYENFPESYDTFTRITWSKCH